MMSEEQSTKTSPQPTVERAENCVSLYANSVVFEGNAWDLKIKFGQLEQVDDQTHVKVIAEISIPWAQAKLGTYWLRAQVEAMELQAGKIAIRRDLYPPEPPPLSGDDAKNPEAVRMSEFLKHLHDEFMNSL